jgi:hypothetical protein
MESWQAKADLGKKLRQIWRGASPKKFKTSQNLRSEMPVSYAPASLSLAIMLVMLYIGFMRHRHTSSLVKIFY